MIEPLPLRWWGFFLSDDESGRGVRKGERAGFDGTFGSG